MSTSSYRSGASRGASPLPPVLNIMVVDAHWANLPLYQRLLSEFPGCRLRCFQDVESAYRASVNNTPDILLIDDEISSIEPAGIARQLSERSGKSDPLVLLLATPQSRLERARAFDVFLPKPINRTTFLPLFHRAVNLRTVRLDMSYKRARR